MPGSQLRTHLAIALPLSNADCWPPSTMGHGTTSLPRRIPSPCFSMPAMMIMRALSPQGSRPSITVCITPALTVPSIAASAARNVPSFPGVLLAMCSAKRTSIRPNLHPSLHARAFCRSDPLPPRRAPSRICTRIRTRTRTRNLLHLRVPNRISSHHRPVDRSRRRVHVRVRVRTRAEILATSRPLRSANPSSTNRFSASRSTWNGFRLRRTWIILSTCATTGPRAIVALTAGAASSRYLAMPDVDAQFLPQHCLLCS